MSGLILLTCAGLQAASDDEANIRSVLQSFNEVAGKGESELFRSLFSRTAEYRDEFRRLNGRDTVIALFAERQIWSERTPPHLDVVQIRMAGPASAVVDAQFSQYGSLTFNSRIPVVLLLRNESGAWKIQSWRAHSTVPVMFPAP